MSIKYFYNKAAKYSFAITILLVLFMSSQVRAQKTVSGTVIDESGLTVPGVNIIEKGTTNSVSTDLDGKFTIKVANAKSVLVFSFLGYTTFSQEVGKNKEISVVLKSATNTLDEVVVVGYGTSKKSDLTGSIVSISGEDLKKVPVANVAEALAGKIAGLQVTSAEGSPDSDVQLRIRGGGSLNLDSSPLIIVDGFPVTNISDISPNDIASVSVLKDASSTAIYGARGAYGVIIITTKSGKDGKISVSYNTFFGQKKMANPIDVLSPQDFVKWQYEYALLNNNSNPASYEDYFGPWSDYSQYVGLKGTNWQKEIFGRTGEVQSHDLGIRGGSDKLSYNFNYSRFDEKSIMVGSDYRRNNASFSLKNKVNNKIDLTFSMRYSDTKVNGGGANEQNEVSSTDSRLKHAVGYAPIPIPGITTDDTDEAISSYLVNPFVAVRDSDRKQFKKGYNMQGGFSWKIIENLKFKSDIGIDNNDNSDYRFYGRSTYYVNNIPAAENQGLAAMIINAKQDRKFRNSNTLNYDFKKLISDKHKLNLLLGEETLNFKTTIQTTVIQGYPVFFGFDDAINLSNQGIAQSFSTYVYPEDKLLSFFGRANYDYKNRYLFTATMRADGSSKFLGNNRWGYFPSAAVAWKIKEEKFLKNVKWLNELKLRFSYGQAGNNNIPTGQTIQPFESGTSTWINGVGSYWAPSTVLANPDLKWETAITKNLGLDYNLFKGKITGTFEVYKNLTSDLLINYPLLGVGYTSQYRNLGEVQNIGFESSLKYVAIDKSNYGLSFSVNIGMNRNRVNSIGLLPYINASTGWASTAISTDYVVKVGQPLGQMFGYVSDGRYEVDDFDYVGGVYILKPGIASDISVIGGTSSSPVPGSMKLKDINGDGVVNTNDQKVIGDANPLSTGGFIIDGNAYGFDISAAFNWSYGNDVYNANKIEFNTSTPNSQYRNLSSAMADGTRWTNLDTTTGALVTDPTALAALNENTTMWSPNQGRYVMSSWAVEDGSFLRLNTLTLGYSLPKEFIEKNAISKLRFYLSCNNVFVLTNYSGPDPEVNTRRKTPLTPGVDYSAFPKNRQFVFGMNLSL